MMATNNTLHSVTDTAAATGAATPIDGQPREFGAVEW